jgi:hypothetical protein
METTNLYHYLLISSRTFPRGMTDWFRSEKTMLKYAYAESPLYCEPSGGSKWQILNLVCFFAGANV